MGIIGPVKTFSQIHFYMTFYNSAYSLLYVLGGITCQPCIDAAHCSQLFQTYEMYIIFEKTYVYFNAYHT